MSDNTEAMVPRADVPAMTGATISDDGFYGLFISRQQSDDTRRGYDASVRDFGAFLGFNSEGAPLAAARILREINEGQANMIVDGYRAHLMRSKQPATTNVRLAALRSLVSTARRFGLIDWELNVESVKARAYRDTSGPGTEAFRKMLERVSGDGAKPRRDRAILHLLYDMALRRGEVVGLDLADVDLAGERPTLSVIGKGCTDAVKISVPPAAANALREWLDVRGMQPGPLFTSLHNGPAGRLTGKSVYVLVQELGEAVGVKARPHGLRHSAITKAAALTGGDLVRVKQFSRHANLNTVARYVDNLRDDGGNVAKLVSNALRDHAD